MDLENFIKETLRSVVNATEDLGKELNREIHLHSQNGNSIEFDLAVTTEETKNKSAQGKINVFQLTIGGDLNNEVKNSTINRISFSIYVDDLNKADRQKERERLLR